MICTGIPGRFANYGPPVLELLGLVELEHNARNNRVRAIKTLAKTVARSFAARDGTGSAEPHCLGRGYAAGTWAKARA
jgi:hypothetical protein